MINYPVGIRGINYQAAYNNLVIDWNARGVVSAPVVGRGNWTLVYSLLFEGAYIDWSGNGQFSGAGGVYGTASGGSSGNLQFVFQGASYTNGQVLAFNDGTIDVPNIVITKASYPIVQACINILKDVGIPGRTYKLDIVRNGVTLFTVRSIYWGTQMATDTDPKYQIIDNQLQATVNPAL